MNYDYHCTSCNEVWEDIQTIANRDNPCKEPCPHCGKESVERPVAALHFSYGGSKSAAARAGDNWNDVLKTIKKNAGPRSTIETR